MGSVQRVFRAVVTARNQICGSCTNLSGQARFFHENPIEDWSSFSSVLRACTLQQNQLGRSIHGTGCQRLKVSGKPEPDHSDKHGVPEGGNLRDPKDGADTVVGAPKTATSAPHDPIGEEQRVDSFVKVDDLEGAADAPASKSLKDAVQDTAGSFGKKVKDLGESIKGSVTSTSESDNETLPDFNDVVEQVGDKVRDAGKAIEERTSTDPKLGDKNIVSQ